MALNSRLKIIVAHNAYTQRGGEDLAVAAEIALLRDAGHHVAEYRRDNNAIQGMSGLGLLGRTLWSRSDADDVTRLIREFRPNLLHVHNTFPLISPSIYWAAFRERLPIVQTLHNFRLLCAQAMFLRDGAICEDCLDKVPWRGIVRRCYRSSSRQSAALVGMLALHRALGTFRDKVTRYIALSEFSRSKFVAGGLPSERVVVKPNYTAIPCVANSRRDGALFVGRLSAEKGVHVLVEALRALPGVSCEIIGNGPQQNLVSSVSRIRWAGWQDPARVQQAMSRAAYLVLPSIGYEQFPRTLAEAYGCSLPIIASRLGSLAELVEDGRTGLLFEPGSAQDLADKIRYAEAHPRALQKMGKNARHLYEAKYTPERNYQRLMEIYADARAATRYYANA